LPKSASIGIKILLYTVDTSVIVTLPNLETLKERSDKLFQDINNWFKVNQLGLTYSKTQYKIQYEEQYRLRLKLKFKGNYVKSSSQTKFLGLITDDSLSWKAHIDHIMSKLNTACFAV
jgi:hypothetical protein